MIAPPHLYLRIFSKDSKLQEATLYQKAKLGHKVEIPEIWKIVRRKIGFLL